MSTLLRTRASTDHRSRVPSRRSVRRVAVAMALALAVTACAGVPDGLATEGPPPGAILGSDALTRLELAVTSSADADLASVAFSLDGEPIDASVRTKRRASLRPGPLADGEHTVVATWTGSRGTGSPIATWTFTVDATPPPLTVEVPPPPAIVGTELAITGTTEAGATVAAGDLTTEADETGAFSLTITAPEGPLVVTATDGAGNTTAAESTLVTVPSRVTLDATRGVHVTACGWQSPTVRDRLLAMVDEGRINAFVLTVKAEDGLVGFRWDPFLAVADPAVVATACFYDLDEAIATLHARGIQVVARIVAFRDPVLAAWAWESGRRDMVIQTPDGEPYRGYGGFLNPAHPDVVEYNLALAETVAAAGADVVLWDYIRRPDGRLADLVFPGLEGTIEEAVVAFTAAADARLAPYGVEHGASVYGIASTRPREIGQDLPAMAEHLDLIAPMIYPSHWGPGEYGLSEPVRAPFDIVDRSLIDHLAAVAGTGARVVPWLEDTTYRAWDRPFQVREQLRATYGRGIAEWFLWDPANRYTPDAITAP